MNLDPKSPLLQSVSQYDVDFVIPRMGIDVPVGIDPFLLFKSRNPNYRLLHSQLLELFNSGINAIKLGRLEDASRLMDFPEVASVGLGYTRKSKRGSGVGSHLTGLIVDTVVGSTSLQARGIRHVEEMQLLSAGIGPDRVSDIAANILKRFLIDYTQRQCGIWEIPLKSGVPITHVLDPKSLEWSDCYEDLPVSPTDGTAILLVPRRIVRALPWINYDDFLRTEFRAYLDAKRRSQRSRDGDTGQPSGENDKNLVVTVTRGDMSLVERYVKSREQQADAARPALDYVDEDACKQSEALKLKLADIPPGRERAADYQRLVLEILNFLFAPELIDGKPEVRTIDGTERRDIIFTNDSDETFWTYVRTNHDGFLLMFEVKNTRDLDIPAINQTSTYLGDRLGRLGIIVTRTAPTEAVQRKIYSIWNDSSERRKVILTIDDNNLKELLDFRCRQLSPTKWMQNHYRQFRTSVQ